MDRWVLGYPGSGNIIIIIIIIKIIIIPYQSEDPSRTLPTYRGKEEKGKIVKDKKGESN